MAKNIERNYQFAKDYYASLGVDTDAALKQLADIPISLHCWQGDDVGGFEPNAGGASGGILSTGNYPGRARTPQELRNDLDKAFSRQKTPEPPRDLPRYRQPGRTKPHRTETLPELDRLGEGTERRT